MRGRRAAPARRGPQSMLSTALGVVSLLLAACGTGTDTSSAAPSATTATTAALQAVIVGSELLVGDQRFPVGILDQNTPVNDATVYVRAFLVIGSNNAQLKSESNAPFRGAQLEGKGLYVAHLTFDHAGQWGAEITAQRPNGEHAVIRLPFTVVASATVPAPGQSAPLSHNPTAKDVSDISTIDSGQPPDDMHQLSVADAIAQHRPTLVAFATPAFCTSATCGPLIHAMQSLEPTYRSRLTFIHIEIWRDFKPDPSKRQLTPQVLEWRLQTDPWVFLIDSKGLIRTRFEGVADADELHAAIDQLLAAP
jgi:hypothetical protein